MKNAACKVYDEDDDDDDDDARKEFITMRWVITQKKPNNGEQLEVKACLTEPYRSIHLFPPSSRGQYSKAMEVKYSSLWCTCMVSKIEDRANQYWYFPKYICRVVSGVFSWMRFFQKIEFSDEGLGLLDANDYLP